MRIGIFGAGGFGRELVGPLRMVHPEAELVFIDDRPPECASLLPVVSLSAMESGDRFVLAIADGHARARLERRCIEAGLRPLRLFHPNVEIGPGVEIGVGAVFCAHTSVTACARIGRQFQCNIYSYIAHDCEIGDHVTFGPRVNCNGNVRIGSHAYIGTGAMIRQGSPGQPIQIGEGAVVGMGAVVTRDVPAHKTVVGNPARVLERKAARAAAHQESDQNARGTPLRASSGRVSGVRP